MYKKVLYNIKKMKKEGGEGEVQYLNPKHMYLKKIKIKKKVKKKIKKMTEPGFEPTISGLEIH